MMLSSDLIVPAQKPIPRYDEKMGWNLVGKRILNASSKKQKGNMKKDEEWVSDDSAKRVIFVPQSQL